MSIEIEGNVLEKACKEMIETIFLCLPDARKGTIYIVGKSPDLVVERVTSGEINNGKKGISWGLPSRSGYDFPGKPWFDYRDEPGRPLEAMGWCVEKQKSWTAEDPASDLRSVRLQVDGELDDFHHMEPVLVRKSDLKLDIYSSLEYPKNSADDFIWNESEYVVVAVIKIHFFPNTIKMNSHKTRVIKKLSRSLGTELLSYQLRQDSMNAMQELARDRLNACDYLADSLRNAITKSGIIFSLIKQEMGYLRDQWEQLLFDDRGEENLKRAGVEALDEILMEVEDIDEETRLILMNNHRKFIELSLPPEQGMQWLSLQIEAKWQELLNNHKSNNGKSKEILKNIERLKKSTYFGQDSEVLAVYNQIPDDLKKEWVDLIYKNTSSFNGSYLESIIRILGNPLLKMPSRKKSKKSLIKLKLLGETIDQLEKNTNFVLRQVLNGNGHRDTISKPQHSPFGSGPEDDSFQS
ncbi:hypothetical protein ACFL1Z_03660 [Thermodesulfobacteriota bacterium]